MQSRVFAATQVVADMKRRARDEARRAERDAAAAEEAQQEVGTRVCILRTLFKSLLNLKGRIEITFEFLLNY
jgi:hypothetical protein